MIKVAFNKDNSKLVFAVESKTRVAVGAAGVKECYVGTLMDYSTDPVTIKENHMEQVTAFDAKWQECPVEITEADEDSGDEGSDDDADEGNTFDLGLKYSDETSQAGIYQLLLIPEDLMFNEDMVTIEQDCVYFGEHVTVKLEDLTLPSDGYYVQDIPSIGGWTLIITDEDAVALVMENGGFEGLTISIEADAGIATLDDAISNAFEINFVYGDDLPNSPYPGDYTPEEPQS